MLTRRKILKLLIKSIFKGGSRSWEVVGKNSDKLSDESLSFDDKGVYYTVRLTTHKFNKDVV